MYKLDQNLNSSVRLFTCKDVAEKHAFKLGIKIIKKVIVKFFFKKFLMSFALLKFEKVKIISSLDFILEKFYNHVKVQ